MSDKKSKGESEEIDFVPEPSFQKSVKKAKRKQTLKFFLIGVLSTLLILFTLYQGASYLLQKKLEQDTDTQLFSQINGANVYQKGQRYVYGFLSAVSHIKIEKTIGGRSIAWNIIEKEVPAIGKSSVIDNGRFVELIGFDERFNRNVHYNSFNGEREVDFYYPQLDYEFLPNELAIATGLDENTLAEIALSFDKPYSIEELSNLLGGENVDWLWVQTETEEEIGLKSEGRFHNLMDGPSADGYPVEHGEFTHGAKGFLSILKQLSEEGNYQSTAKHMAKGINQDGFPEVSDIRITGAVVTGTPEELKRFEDLETVRASTIGATIDLY